MKKIIFRVIALALIAIMCLGAVACGNTGNQDVETSDTTSNTSASTEASTTATTTASTDAETTGNGGEGGEGGTNVNSEEALFAEILKAYEASMAYQGALTINATQGSLYQEGEEAEKATADMSMSADPAKNIYFEKESSQITGSYASTYESVNKTFIVDGAVYEYDKYSSESANSQPNNNETYYKNAESIKIEDISEYMTEMVGGVIGGVSKAETYAALKAAFAKVFSELKARAIADYVEDGALKEGETITVEPAISIKKEAGETVLTIVSKFAVDELADDSDEMIKNYVIDYTRTIAAKDGKISKVGVDYDMSADVSVDGATESMKFAAAIDLTYNMVYSFDQATYDAITVSLPTDPAQIVDAAQDDIITVNWHIGTIDDDHTYYPESENVSYIFLDYTEDIQRACGYERKVEADEFGNYVEVEDYYVKVKGFYKDAALTQAIDTATITNTELIALGDVYVDVEIKDGMAIVSECYGEPENQLSIEYQIVDAQIFAYSSASLDKNPRAVRVSDPLRIRDEGNDSDYKILVNGVETAGETITLESGKVYLIETVRIIKDADKDIEYIIPELF